MEWVSRKHWFQLDFSTFIHGNRCLSVLTLCNSFILVDNLPYCHRSTPNLSAQFLTLKQQRDKNGYKSEEVSWNFRFADIDGIFKIWRPQVVIKMNDKRKVRTRVDELKCANGWCFIETHPLIISIGSVKLWRYILVSIMKIVDYGISQSKRQE